MNKLFYIISLSLLLILTGCSKDLNFYKIESRLEMIRSDEFSYTILKENLDSFSGEEIPLDEAEEYFNLDFSNFSDGYIKSNHSFDNFELIMVLKPLGISLDEASKEVDNFFENLNESVSKANLKNMIKTRHNGNLVYLITDNNQKYLESINTAYKKIINNPSTLSNQEILNKYGLTDISDSFIKEEQVINGNKIMILKTTDPQTVKEKLDNYFKQIKNFETEIVKNKYDNRLIIIKDNYVICLITDDNEKVLKLIEEK